MAQDYISMPLVMASIPKEASEQAYQYGSGSYFTRYHLIRFVQRCGVFCLIGGLSFGFYAGFSQYVINSVKVIGTSMVPNLNEGGSYLLYRMAFHQRDPQRFDIVVLRDPGDHGLSVKRIIGTPGEAVQFKEGSVFVNDKKLDESYLTPHTRTFTYAHNERQIVTCGKDQYFVLGDNRELSVDSRSYGPVSREDLLGLVKK
jgi:signal peptidase I